MRQLSKARTLFTLMILCSLLAVMASRSEPVHVSAAPGKLIVGYAAGWSVNGRADAAALNGDKLSVIIYAFVGISGNTCTAEWIDLEAGHTTPTIPANKMADVVLGLTDNRGENPDLKVLMSIGGGGYASRFEQITNYTDFANSCVGLMEAHGLDGIDVDYEFPTTSAGTARMNEIVKAMRAALNNPSKNWSQNGAGTGTKLLTVGAAAGPYSGQWQDAATLDDYVDYFTTMAYNYHGSWESSVHFNSPNAGCDQTTALCMPGTAYYWNTTRGVAREKLLIGLGFYGNQYTTPITLPAPVPNPPPAHCGVRPGGSSYTAITTIDYKTMRTNGMLSGSSSPGTGWIRTYDGTYQNASLCSDASDTWIGYEDPSSAAARATWIKDNPNYPGIMMWELFKDYNSEMLNAVCGVYTCNSVPDNLAHRKSTSDSGSCSTSETAAKAVNGTFVGGNMHKWCSNAASRWMQVDLGAAYGLNKFVLYHAGAGGESTAYNTRDFNIQISADNVNWTTVVNVAGNTASMTTHTIGTTNGRYVRLNVINGQQSGTTARIYELMVFGGTVAGSPAPTATRTHTPVSASGPTATRPPASATRTATAVPSSSTVPPWEVGKSYAVGNKVTYDGATYTCSMAHSSIQTWEPPNTPTLWTRN